MPKDSSSVAEHGPGLAGAQGEHGGVVGGALGAAVPRPVVVGAVVVVLAVGLVVLVVVGDQVAQGEAVVDRDQVHRGGRAAPRPAVHVRRPAEPGGELPHPDRVAAPEVAHGVPVPAVPLAPARREPAEVVAVHLPDVPGLGDQLDPGDHRILRYQVEEGRTGAELALLPGQRGRQVKPVAVDVHLGDPVPQRVHDQLQGPRVARVQRVPAAGRVHVQPRVGRVQPVVRRVVQPAEAQRRAGVVALGGVVEHHVEQDLDPGRVQRVHHRLELGHLAAGPPGPDRGRVRPGAARSSRSCCNPSSWSAPRCTRNASGTLSCTGSSSTAVTPRSRRWAMAASWPRPA